MKSSEFVRRALDIANNLSTLYVLGCFGAPLKSSTVQRYIDQYSYNKSREQQIRAHTDKRPCVFGFDCVCLVKAILWGFSADENHQYGGAVYQSNGVPDIGEDEMIRRCLDVSTDFSNIVPGEVVWITGHFGIYVGDGKVVECTPAWKNRVQITTLGNLKREGTYRIWTKHGKLPYLEYDTAMALGAEDYIALIAKKAGFNDPAPAIGAMKQLKYKYALDLWRKIYEKMK